MHGLRRRDDQSGVTLVLVIITMAVLLVVAYSLSSTLASTLKTSQSVRAQYAARGLAQSVNELGSYQVRSAGMDDTVGKCYWWAKNTTRPESAPASCERLTTFKYSNLSGSITEGLIDDDETATVVITFEDPYSTNESLGIYTTPTYDYVPYARIVIASTATSADDSGGPDQTASYTSTYLMTYSD